MSTTCDPCLSGTHKCLSKRSSGRIQCPCSVCGKPKLKVKPSTPTQVRNRAARTERIERTRSDRQKSKDLYGVCTDFTTEEVETVFEMKAAGKGISEIARKLDTTRDRVRTIYNAPASPPPGLPVQPQPYIVKGDHMKGNEHLDKAKAALAAAKEIHDGFSPQELFDNKRAHKEFLHLMDMASVQAALAQAEALTRIAARWQ